MRAMPGMPCFRGRTAAAVVFVAALAAGSAACAAGGTGGGDRAMATLGPGFRPDMFLGRVDHPNHEAVIAAPVERVWLAIADAFEAIDLPIGYVDDGRHAVGVEGFRLEEIGGERPSALVECGRGPTATPVADLYFVTMAYEVLLAPEASGGTRVDIAVQAYAHPRADAGHPVRCTSTRALERMIVDGLADTAARIGASAG